MAVWQVAIIFNLMCYSNATASYQKPPLSTSIYIYIHIYIYIYIYIHIYIYIYIVEQLGLNVSRFVNRNVACYLYLYVDVCMPLVRANEEGLTLVTSALKLFTMANLRYQLS